MRQQRKMMNIGVEEGTNLFGTSLEALNEWENVKDAIRPRLVDVREREYLQDKPHTFVADIPVIYEFPIKTNVEGSSASAIVTDSLLKHWGVTLEELDEQARKNLKGVPTPLDEVIREISGDEMADMLTPPEGMPTIMVLTNNEKLHGASEILNTGLMKRLCCLFGGEVAVIPSSIHECLILPAGTMDVEQANEMIKCVNATQLAEDDILSDKLYIYNPDSGLRIA